MTHRTLLTALTLAIGLALSIWPALHAQAPAPAHEGYMHAMAKMNQDMPKDSSGNPNVDFARMMIPHHQGASDAAKVFLQHGKDPMLRRMARKMIKDQSKEIADLQEWLKKHQH